MKSLCVFTISTVLALLSGTRNRMHKCKRYKRFQYGIFSYNTVFFPRNINKFTPSEKFVTIFFLKRNTTTVQHYFFLRVIFFADCKFIAIFAYFFNTIRKRNFLPKKLSPVFSDKICSIVQTMVIQKSWFTCNIIYCCCPFT